MTLGSEVVSLSTATECPHDFPQLSGYELPCHREWKVPTIDEVWLVTGHAGATCIPSTARVAGSPPGQCRAHRASSSWRITVSFVSKVGPVVL